MILTWYKFWLISLVRSMGSLQALTVGGHTIHVVVSSILNLPESLLLPASVISLEHRISVSMED